MQRRIRESFKQADITRRNIPSILSSIRGGIIVQLALSNRRPPGRGLVIVKILRENAQARFLFWIEWIYVDEEREQRSALVASIMSDAGTAVARIFTSQLQLLHKGVRKPQLHLKTSWHAGTVYTIVCFKDNRLKY